jgi:hypothetical protein
MVISGFDAFKMSDSLGIPLDLIVNSIYNNDMVIDWYEFYLTGISVGWTYERILIRIESSFDDNQICCKEILTRIKKYSRII